MVFIKCRVDSTKIGKLDEARSSKNNLNVSFNFLIMTEFSSKTNWQTRGPRTHVRNFSLHISGSIQMKYDPWESDVKFPSLRFICKLIWIILGKTSIRH